jgi:hypothetical protein
MLKAGREQDPIRTLPCAGYALEIVSAGVRPMSEAPHTPDCAHAARLQAVGAVLRSSWMTTASV